MHAPQLRGAPTTSAANTSTARHQFINEVIRYELRKNLQVCGCSHCGQISAQDYSPTPLAPTCRDESKNSLFTHANNSDSFGYKPFRNTLRRDDRKARKTLPSKK